MNKSDRIRELEYKLEEYEVALRYNLKCPKCDAVVKVVNIKPSPTYENFHFLDGTMSTLRESTIDRGWYHDSCGSCGVVVAYRSEIQSASRVVGNEQGAEVSDERPISSELKKRILEIMRDNDYCGVRTLDYCKELLKKIDDLLMGVL